MIDGVILGILQGITEWLPVSSEGVVAAFSTLFLERTLSEAVAYALWLHMGTAVSALIAFRRTLTDLVREVIAHPKHPPPLFRYLLVSTTVSAMVGFPLLLLLDSLSGSVGAATMGLIGLLMLVNGFAQLPKPLGGARSSADVSLGDALLAGVAQGLAALPGISRSGLTVAALLARQVDRKEALRLSFLMSVPASLGAGIYASIGNGLFTSGGALLAMCVAAIVGLATIRTLMSVAERLNFAVFVLAVGAAMLVGAGMVIWQGSG